MKPSESIKPISYLKTHASKLIRDVFSNQKTLIITQNGEAKVILQDVRIYEQTQDSLALLKILAQSSKSLKDGQFNLPNVPFPIYESVSKNSRADEISSSHYH